MPLSSSLIKREMLSLLKISARAQCVLFLAANEAVVAFAGQMWLYHVFRLTLLSNPMLGGSSREMWATPDVPASPGASLRFLRRPAPPSVPASRVIHQTAACVQVVSSYVGTEGQRNVFSALAPKRS